MSEDSGIYQNPTQVPQEQVAPNELSNAIDEKLVEDSKILEDTGSLEESAAESEVKEEDSKFNSKFAALSRKEKDIRNREAELEQKIAQFQKKFEELEKPREEDKPAEPGLEYRLKKDPLKTLEDLGLSYEILTKLALNDGEMPADMQMNLMREELEQDYKNKFEQLESRLLEKEKAEEEAKYNQVIEDYKVQINSFVGSSEDYELIQANEAQDLVYEVIEEHYNTTGRILETKEAADQVEAYLEEELKTVLKKSKKLGGMMTSVAERPAQEKRQSPTLSNSLSAQGVAHKADTLLPREESIAQLAKQIKWID